MFSWENDHVIVYRISEKDGAIPRINLILIQQGENTYYSCVNRRSLYQNGLLRVSHFCEHCLHWCQRMDLLERHKPECKGLLKSRPTRTELRKQGENKVSFTNYLKQMKAPFQLYADLLLKKMNGYDLPKTQEDSFTLKTETHYAEERTQFMCSFCTKLRKLYNFHFHFASLDSIIKFD